MKQLDKLFYIQLQTTPCLAWTSTLLNLSLWIKIENSYVVGSTHHWLHQMLAFILLMIFIRRWIPLCSFLNSPKNLSYQNWCDVVRVGISPLLEIGVVDRHNLIAYTVANQLIKMTVISDKIINTSFVIEVWHVPHIKKNEHVCRIERTGRSLVHSNAAGKDRSNLLPPLAR